MSLSITDLSPKFLALYEEAVRENASPDVRWELSFPDRPETDSIEFTRGWPKQAEQHRVEILQGIRPFLTSDKRDDIERFTIGPGPTGLEREAYYVGWLVIGDWLAHGMSFADFARIPENEMPQRVTSEIDAERAAPKLLAQSVQHEFNFCLFYKTESQEKNLSRGRNFSTFAAHLIEQDLF